MKISNVRIRQIVTEEINRLITENDLKQVLTNFNDYRQQINQYINIVAQMQPQDQNAMKFIQYYYQYLYALSAALGRCVANQSINEGRKWDFTKAMMKDAAKDALKNSQLSNTAGFLNDIGIKVPQPIRDTVRGYQRGKNWAEMWGQRYIQNRRKERNREKNSGNTTTQQSQQQGQQQGQRQQTQQQQSQQQMPNLTMYELYNRFYDGNNGIFIDSQLYLQHLEPNEQDIIQKCNMLINQLFTEYNNALHPRTQI